MNVSHAEQIQDLWGKKRLALVMSDNSIATTDNMERNMEKRSLRCIN